MAWWDDAFKAVGNAVSSTASAVVSATNVVAKAVGDSGKAVGNFVAPVGNIVAGAVSAVANNPVISTAVQVGGNIAGSFVGMPLAGTMLVGGAKAVDGLIGQLRPVSKIVEDVQGVVNQASNAVAQVGSAGAVAFAPAVSSAGSMSVNFAKNGTIPVTISQFFKDGFGKVGLTSDFNGNAWAYVAGRAVRVG